MIESHTKPNGAAPPPKPANDQLREAIRHHMLVCDKLDENGGDANSRLLRSVGMALIRWRFDETLRETDVGEADGALVKAMAWMLLNSTRNPNLGIVRQIGLFNEVAAKVVGHSVEALFTLIKAEAAEPAADKAESR